ncbi:transmembrane protein 241 isoform X2 [Phyllostomus hastatus]|uniref:transmembrane protein 241 isoform X2 n=1 Tax=Phyllostomus hastatus TaxID=9423 RepID=UPI001E68492A|nr:transmembrane protein 241 isoform X2 [Phyllostomus hastatus]
MCLGSWAGWRSTTVQGRGEERERETLTCERETLISCLSHAPKWRPARKPGVCSDQESDWRFCGLSNVLTWLPASVLFVGIIYAGSRALSRLAIPVFLTLHNAAEVIICGHQKCFRKEKMSPARICSALFLLAAAGCLPFNDAQFDPDGYFWAVIHLFCMGAYKILQKSQKPNALSDIDQQYLNYIFSVVLLAFASHPTGDLLSVLDFPFLYFYRFHGSCCASGFLGFFLMFSTAKLKSLMAPGQCAAWIFFAKVITAGLSILLFDVTLTSATMGCLLLGGLGEALLVFSERKGA